MNLDRLQTFLVASELLNFTNAGRQLHLTQSAISQQMRDLEEDLGVALFERRGRGLLLTPAGQRLRASGRTIVDGIVHARQELQSLQGVSQGVLRVGASALPGIYLLPHALNRFAQHEPGIGTSLFTSTTDDIMARLRAGELDLAIVGDEPGPEDLGPWRKRPWLEDEIVLVVPPDHPWASRDAIDVADLTGATLIMRPPYSPIRRAIIDQVSAAAKTPVTLAPRFEMDNSEGIKHAVMAGLGAGWISRHACLLERSANMLAEVTITDVRIVRTLWLVEPARDRQLPQGENFVRLLDDALAWLPAEVKSRR